MAKIPKTIEPINADFDVLGKSLVSQDKSLGKLKALYQAPLPIAGVDLECAVLDDHDNTRVIGMTSVFTAFDRVARSNNRVISVPAFMDAKNLQPYINQELKELIKPIEYFDGKAEKMGYNALILSAMCEMYLQARRDGVLVSKQVHLAEKAEILQSAFARLGMIALIDEATGFQRDRSHDALRILLEKYISEGMQKWIKTFPDSFFKELDKLYDNQETKSQKRPQYYGSFINKYVYDPIENGYVKRKLDKLNIKDNGKRKARFHQWLSDEGKQVLTRQIGRVEMLMELCPDIEAYKKAARKQKMISIAPYLFDDMNQIID